MISPGSSSRRRGAWKHLTFSSATFRCTRSRSQPGAASFSSTRRARGRAARRRGLDAQFKRYRLGELRIGKRIVADVQANWKLLRRTSRVLPLPAGASRLCRVVTAYRDAGAWAYAAGIQRRIRGRRRTLTLDGRARLPRSRVDRGGARTIYVRRCCRRAVPQRAARLRQRAPDVSTGPQSVRIVYDWLFEPSACRSPRGSRALCRALDITTAKTRATANGSSRHASREFQHGYYVPQEFDCHRFAQWVREG